MLPLDRAVRALDASHTFVAPDTLGRIREYAPARPTEKEPTYLVEFHEVGGQTTSLVWVKDTAFEPTRLFLDMDGVLADFDAGFFNLTGKTPKDYTDAEMWRRITAHEPFYFDLPPMPDLAALWAHTAKYHPTVLTGVPYSLKERCTLQKLAWVAQHLTPTPPLIACMARDKSLHLKPGDVLVDDRIHYRDLWINRGGQFVHHRDAATTIADLRELGFH